jgi:hypothetical protein
MNVGTSMFSAMMVLRAEVRRNASGSGGYGDKKSDVWELIVGAMPSRARISCAMTG